MDIKNYISSGIIERYALGSASVQEMKEVECMSHIYPEIKEELTQIQSSIEAMAMASAVQPPEYLKSNILDKVGKTTQLPKDEVDVRKNIKATKIYPLFSQLVAAASFLLMLSFAFLFYKKNQHTKLLNSENLDLATEKISLSNEVASLHKTIEEESLINSILAHTDTKKIKLGGTDHSPNSKVDLYWNPTTSDILLKVGNLPTPVADKQYQLWAIVDGQPKDMGVFNIDTQSDTLQKMGQFMDKNPQAFAITLEKKGGSKVPTMSEMYVIGNR